MNESRVETSPQPNGGVKQKPNSLNLAPGFHRNVNGRVSLNDRQLRGRVGDSGFAGNGRDGPRIKFSASNSSISEHLSALSAVSQSLALSASATPVSSAVPAWSVPSEFEALLEPSPPPPPAPSHSLDEQQQLPTRSPCHNGFSLYTPPTPIHAAHPSKVRATPNGLPQPAPRRPHSIAATPQYHRGGVGGLEQSGRAAAALVPATPVTSANLPTPGGLPPATAPAASCLQRRSYSAASTPVSALPPAPAAPPDVPSLSAESALQPGLGLQPGPRALPMWESQLEHHFQQQRLPRRPHSIASTPVAGPGTPVPAPPVGNGALPRTPGEPIQWGPTGMVLHQPIPRRPYSSTMPHPQPPTPTSQSPGLSILANPGNSNTWTPGGSLRPRPHSMAAAPQQQQNTGTTTTLPPPAASPSDSGYRSLPSATSDYQILKSPNVQANGGQQQKANGVGSSASRRLSLPSAQSLLRANGPKPSPTFHGSPFRPFTCGVSSNGNPIFLGCTHLHGTSASTGNIARTPTPASTPSIPLTTSQAIQQLLGQPRNGFKIADDKVALFMEILDTQERIAQVSWEVGEGLMV